MKKINFLPWLAFAALFMLGYASHSHQAADKPLAEVPQKEGIYLFWDNKPVDTYEVVGTVGVLTFSGSYQEMSVKLAKKAKKQYPEAEALIYQADKDVAVVIKFKK